MLVHDCQEGRGNLLKVVTGKSCQHFLQRCKSCRLEGCLLAIHSTCTH